jgi:branched-chain amino acid transport system permease protein
MTTETLEPPIVAAQPSRIPRILAPAAMLALVIGLFLVPRHVESTYALHMMILVFINVIIGSSWNIIGGYTGQYSVGHAAYFGVGAYSVMILMQYRQIAPWWGIWVGAAVAIVIAIVIGSICFRLRGPYFVLASIAVAEIFRVSALNLKNLTNGAEGLLVTEIPPLVIAGRTVTDWYSKVPFYYTGLVCALVIIFVSWLVRRSKLGYYFQAIREDQDAAHSLGINLTLYKNISLAISAMFTAMAGSLYAVYVGFIDPSTVLALDLSVSIVMLCICGGIGTISGPVIGAVVLVPLSEALRSNMLTDALIKAGVVSEETGAGAFMKAHLSQAHMLIYGILVVIVILFMPQGILGFLKRVTARLTTRKARP